MCFRPPTVGKRENKCPQCGTVSPGDAQQCSNCGAEFPRLPGSPGMMPGVAPGAPKAPGAGVPKTPPAPVKAPGQL